MAPSTPTNNDTTSKILIINPNTTQSMTDALRPLISSLGFSNTEYTFFTAPSGVPSINNEHDATLSCSACLPSLIAFLDSHDAFLVCCYSAHPLVPALRQELRSRRLGGRPRGCVTGIFDASVSAALDLLAPTEKFGIVSTGSQWQGLLDGAVASYLGTTSGDAPSERFAGTETTGLNADELHATPKEVVDRRIKAAVKVLLGRGARVICLGCAGMSGMDETVRQACAEEKVEGVRVVDGVVWGAVILEGMMRTGV